jgi:excisionase family DNA binding protein
LRLLLLSGSLEQGEAGEAREQDVPVVQIVALEVEVKGAVHMGKKRPLVGDRLLTVGEVAATMRVSNMTVYRLIKSGQLAAIRVGKNYRIRESEIDRYLSERSVRTED